MKIKNVKQTFLIFLSLIILSFSFYSFAQNNSSTDKNIFLDSDQDGLSDAEEKAYGTDPQNSDTDGDSYSDGVEVKSGYDPLKPAPGDKLVQEETATVSAPAPTVLGATTDEDNLTQKVSEKVAELMEEQQTFAADNTTLTDDSTSTGTLSAEDLQSAIDEIISQNVTEDPLPEISASDIKIKKQDYDKLSDEEKADRKKEDFAVYVASMFYIFSSNSPTPITSGNDFSKISSTIQNQIVQAISSRDSSLLNDWAESGKNMLEQMKEVEVPEELADTHIHALRMALYAENAKSYINSSSNDPILDITKLTKLGNFVNEAQVFFDETSTKLKEYGITYDDDLKQRLKTQGVILPEEITSDTSNE